MEKDLNKLAKKIIRNNQYLTLSTTDKNGKPWVSIMAYVIDQNYNFYFISQPTSLHSKHIKNNPDIALTIYDSRQPFGLGVGLQIKGLADEIGEKDQNYVEKIYFGRRYPYGNIDNLFVSSLKILLHNKTYHFYKINITSCWINDPNSDTDKRVLVRLK